MRKITMLIIALTFSEFVHSQDTTSFNFTFNHLTLAVKDLDRSVEFYKKVLLLVEINNRAKVQGIRWLSLDGDKQLHISSIGNENILIDTSIHFALATKNFEAFIKRLKGRKIPFTDSDGNQNIFSIRADGVKQIYFQDPDGYWIEVNNIGQKKN